MKHLSLILLLLFSTTCLGEWVSVEGKPYSYVDYERLKKDKGLIYFWELIDYLSPRENGILSHTVFAQGDCKLFRKKTVSFSSYTQPMGAGNGIPYDPKNSNWMEPSPGSAMETMVKSACELAR